MLQGYEQNITKLTKQIAKRRVTKIYLVFEKHSFELVFESSLNMFVFTLNTIMFNFERISNDTNS